MLDPTIRVLAFVVGGLSFLGGLVELRVSGGDAGSGVVGILFGTVIMVAAVIQRSRYRSEAAERTHETPGPGGGESGYLEPRFLPTTEVFADPTSRRVMRVYVDPGTGERRYRAEG
jgi:hypothetical protein